VNALTHLQFAALHQQYEVFPSAQASDCGDIMSLILLFLFMPSDLRKAAIGFRFCLQTPIPVQAKQGKSQS